MQPFVRVRMYISDMFFEIISFTLALTFWMSLIIFDREIIEYKLTYIQDCQSKGIEPSFMKENL